MEGLGSQVWGGVSNFKVTQLVSLLDTQARGQGPGLGLPSGTWVYNSRPALPATQLLWILLLACLVT